MHSHSLSSPVFLSFIPPLIPDKDFVNYFTHSLSFLLVFSFISSVILDIDFANVFPAFSASLSSTLLLPLYFISSVIFVLGFANSIFLLSFLRLFHPWFFINVSWTSFLLSLFLLLSSFIPFVILDRGIVNVFLSFSSLFSLPCSSFFHFS